MIVDVSALNLAFLGIVSVTNLALAVIVVYSSWHNVRNSWFAAIILSIIIWTAANYLADNVQDYNWSLFWTRLTFSAPLLFSWLFVVFAKVFPKYRYNFFWRWFLIGTFLLQLLIQVWVFATSFVVSDIIQSPRGVDVMFGSFGLWYAVYVIIGILLALLVLAWKLKTETGEDKTRVGYVLFGLSFFTILATITNLVIPLIFHYFFASVFGPYLAIIFTGITTYAIIRHRLLRISILAPQVFTLFIGSVLLFEVIVSDDLTRLIIRSVIFIWYAALAYLLIRGVQREVRLVDQLSEANKHLKELMDIKTEFLHIASHQLRTPLTGLRGYLEMQANGEFDKFDQEKRHQLHKEMYNAANQLNAIVNDLLDAMELEGGSLNFKMEPVQLEEMVSEIMDQLKPNYDKKGLKLEFEKPDPALPKVEADQGYLRQVFLNMIDNAEKYTLKGGVTIMMQSLGDKVEVEVKDTGIGIDPAEKDKLFGKFVRGSRSQQVHTDGSGLGLFIIKKIVTEHGGEVFLESEGINKGTTMRVVLPIAQKK